MKILARENEYGITVEAYHNENKICEYRFTSTHRSHPIGKELIRATLLSWATIDLCFAEEIFIETSVSEYAQEYIQKNFQLVCSSYVHIYHKKLAILSFTKETLSVIPTSFSLEKNNYFLGATGGRDSTLCRYILEKAEKAIQTYAVSYDNAPHLPDGHVDMEVFIPKIYNTLSVSGIKQQSDIISTHQADDIHVTFAAPYFNLKEGMPANLAVGLPWESIHMLSNGIPDLVPTESFESIRLLIQLFRNYGLLDFQIVSPIATLHSVGVYGLLERIIGADKLRELDSCWHSTSFSGKPCEACPKCQRLKFIFKYLSDEPYLKESPTLFIQSADFLFGSLFGFKILEKFPKINWNSHSIIDDTSLAFSNGFESIIQNEFGMTPIPMHDFSVEYSEEAQSWDALLKQIKEALGIDYDLLSDTPVHALKVPFLPFEKDYKWKRKHQILQCYGSFTAYENFKPVLQKISDQGNHLDLPELPIFRKWLNSAI